MPEGPATKPRSHPVITRTRSARSLGLAAATLLVAATAAGCGVAAGSSAAATGPAPGSSSASPPEPMAVSTAKVPAAKKAAPKHSHPAMNSGASSASAPTGLDGYKGTLELDATGSQLTGWNQTADYCPQTSGMVGNGTVGTGDEGDATLTTSSAAGSCVGLISPGLYSSAVIEADIDFPALPSNGDEIANWCGFWLTNGAQWPQAGELDAVEVEPVNAANAVTWHSGTTSAEFSASTSGFSPVQLPVTGPNLSPGWHLVDIVYTKGYFAVYYDGVQFTSYTSSNVTGDPLNVYLTMANTPNTAAIQQLIGSPPINSSTKAATMSVRYVKVWSFR